MKGIFLIAFIASVVAGAGSWGGLFVHSLPVMTWAVLIIFAFQALAFVPAYIYQTERYYDLIGSMTYIAVIVFSLCSREEPGLRRILIAFFVIVWAIRLGGFLYLRILRDGSDSRFDKIKPSPLLFFRTWMLQGLWVAVTAGAALAAITSSISAPLHITDALAIALWVLGFAVEAISDSQKRRFRKAHGSEKFVNTGLWALSRHPNYLGEIILWTGVAILAFPTLQSWQYVTLVSPIFVYILLTRISGIPLLEYKSDRRWGDDAAYVNYKAATPVLFPRWKLRQ